MRWVMPSQRAGRAQGGLWPRWVAGLFACAALALNAHAQELRLGQTTQGNTGGLVIPSAEVLPEGSVAATVGNYSEPQLGSFSRRRNLSFGVGLLPNVELFGRRVEYQNPLPDSTFVNGPRDISASVKLRLPSLWREGPKIAVGANDVGGGAVFFKSLYAVVGDQYGPVRWSAGYARGRPIGGAKGGEYAFDGLFGGAEVELGRTGLSLLAEYDGQQKHAGLRYYSAPITGLGHAQVIATVQRSFGAAYSRNTQLERSSVAVSLVVPFGQNAERPPQYRPEAALAPIGPAPAAPAMVPTAEDRLESLRAALARAGLERVRVGSLAGDVIIEYENHRFGQNDADAVGVVLGLGVEFAPAGARRVYAVALKAGLPLYETSVGVAEYRNFLRDGDAGFARGSLAFDRAPAYQASHIQWIAGTPTRHSRVRVEIGPDVNYTLGTEVAAFDYSAAVNVQAFVPLWRGAELYASATQRVAESDTFGPEGVFSASRRRNGLKVAAVQQSFWLGRHVVATVGAGRFRYDSLGVQAESTIFVPGRDDQIRLRAAGYDRESRESQAKAFPGSASYRYVHSPTTWLEAGVQRYTDGSRGPSLVLTRWFGDVGMHLTYRKGGTWQFGGLELSIPLTPRRGMAPGAITLAGTPEFRSGARTRLALGSVTVNTVNPSAVREFEPDYGVEAHQLNRGRLSEKYFIGQLYRMREAFYLYGREHLPR